MNRETTDKMNSSLKQNWETPPAIVEKLDQDFGRFDLDLCADESNTVFPNWLGPSSPLCCDALRGDWQAYGKRGFANPEYGKFVAQILPIAKQAGASGFESLFLLPMRVTKAFRANILNGASDLIFCSQRITFFEDGVPRINKREWEENGMLRADPAVFDSILVRFRPGIWVRPRISEWKVPVHVTKADLERAREQLLSRQGWAELVKAS